MAKRTRPYPKESPKFTKSGSFTAWIFATKGEPPHTISAFSCLIIPSDAGEEPIQTPKVSERIESTEQRAYVAAVYRVVEALPEKSKIEIYCRAKNIQDAINMWVDDEWPERDWARVEHVDLWKRFLAARDGTAKNPRRIKVSASRWSDGDYANTYERLRDQARQACNERIRELKLVKSSQTGRAIAARKKRRS